MMYIKLIITWDHYKRNCGEKTSYIVQSWWKDLVSNFVWWKLTLHFYIFGSIRAFAKILSANFCTELFFQSFLPPKFCIIRYTYHLNHVTIKTNLCVTNGWEDIAIWLSNCEKEIVFFFSLMLYHGGCFHWTHQRLVTFNQILWWVKWFMVEK